MKPLSGIIGMLCAALLVAAPAQALNPALSIAQYKHTRWTIDEGAPAVIAALAQGLDGYLWIGARDGLYRFDGVTFEPIAPPKEMKMRSRVSAIGAARDGSIWAGYATGGIAIYRDGKMQDAQLPNASAYIISIKQGADGDMWALQGSLSFPLVRYRRGHWEEIGANWNLPPEYVVNMMTGRDGTLWIATLQSIYFLSKNAKRFERYNAVPAGHASLSEDGAGRLWISDDAGTRTLRVSSIDSGLKRQLQYLTPGFPRATRTFFDRDGNLWGNTGRDGIFRVPSPSVTGPASPMSAASSVERLGMEGLASNIVSSLIEDREGNLWVASTIGLERFRSASVIIEPALTKLATWGFSLLGASDGTVYVGQRDSVFRISPGGKPEPLIERQRETEAICEGPKGTVWIVLQDRIVKVRGNTIISHPRPRSPILGFFDCAVDRRDQLRLGQLGKDALVRRNGVWQQTGTRRQNGGAQTMLADRQGRVLIYYQDDSILRIDTEGQSTKLKTIRPHALAGLHTIYQGRNDLLVGGLFGIARLRDAQLTTLTPKRVPAFANVNGIVQTLKGETWFMGGLGIGRVDSATLERAFDDPQVSLQLDVFDWRDGSPGVFISDGKRDAVSGGDGRVWFATTGGVVWVDPSHLPYNALPPPVRISAATIRGVRFRDPATLDVSAGASNFEFDFAVPSLTMPERVRVLYKLEGADSSWIDPGMRRQAFYTNLAPGHYVFRVIAANNDGVWNRTGATLAFEIPPTFIQSNLFRALCLGGALLLLWAAYQIRVRQLTGKMRERLEERLSERERIARDLHDTLLQGFQGLILRFQSVANEIPENLNARRSLSLALDSADVVLSKGRDSVQLLRKSRTIEIAQALSETAERMRADYPVEFKLVVEGATRPLHPVVHEEVCRIGEEAIINAFQHGQASQIEVALSYSRSELRLGVRDDGVGIEPAVFADGGRQGHFGMVGMRERADQINAVLSVSSRPAAGTEIQLTVPGQVAYSTNRRRSLRCWFGLSRPQEGDL